MKRTKVLVIAVSLVAAGCTGGDDDDGGGNSLTVDELGGFVGVSAGASGGSLFGAFYSDVTVTPDPGRITIGPTDECELDEDSNPTVTVTTLDVGTDIRAESGSTTIVAVRSTGGTTVFYEGEIDTAAPVAEYTIRVAGNASADVDAGTLTTIRVPTDVTLGAYTIVPGQPLELTFTGGEGASVVILDLEDFDFSVSYSCAIEPDGSFTVPAEITTAIGVDGDVFASAATEKLVRFNGRKVLVSAEPN